MKRVISDVYECGELDAESFKKAYDEWTKTWEYAYIDEVEDTIKGFEDEFGVKFEGWSASPYGHTLDRLWFDDYTDETLMLKGNRARSWFWNKHRDLWSRQYLSMYKGGELKSRRSMMFREKASCPWTGTCFDMDALIPLYEFMDGTGNSRKERDDDKTVREILMECADELLASVCKDMYYMMSEEEFIDECKNYSVLFYADGTKYIERKGSKCVAVNA